MLQYVNRGLFNLRANDWLRGWGGCGCTLNGKPALLCAVVMGGDYLAMQKDWMNASPQIGHTLSLLPTNLSLSLILDVYYLYYTDTQRECFNHTDMEAEGGMVAGRIFGLFMHFVFILHSLLFVIGLGFMIFLQTMQYFLIIFSVLHHQTSLFWFECHILFILWMLLTIIYFCQLRGNATVLNIHLTGYLMFTPEKDQYHSAIVQTSFFKLN